MMPIVKSPKFKFEVPRFAKNIVAIKIELLAKSEGLTSQQAWWARFWLGESVGVVSEKAHDVFQIISWNFL